MKLTFTILFLFLTLANAYGYEIDRALAIKAIIGEAENQGLVGMTAVGEAIRNRGHLKGVYGVKSKRVNKAPKWVYKQAEKAWDDSANTNLVKGADHWESTDFKQPSWSINMKETAKIGKHRFYRSGGSK